METIRERNIGGVSDLGSSWQTHYLEDALFFPSGYRPLSNPSSDENAKLSPLSVPLTKIQCEDFLLACHVFLHLYLHVPDRSVAKKNMLIS
jgi:hypothetical protein